MTLLLIIFAIVIIGLSLLYNNQLKATKSFKEQSLSSKEEAVQKVKDLENYKEQFKDIINVNEAVAAKKIELDNVNLIIENQKIDFNKQKELLDQDYSNHKIEVDKQKDQLNQDYIGKRNIYENLLAEVSILEENLEDISYGLYKPHYDYTSSEEYKQKLTQLWNKEKEMIKADKATFCPTEWQVRGSKVEGRKMVKNHSKLMLRAFNGECDSAIAKVSWNNIGTVEARLSKAFDAINNLGSSENITITKDYSDLKFQELRLEFELQQKIQEEKDEQKKIREQMREEQKAQQELEKAKQDAEQEESRYQKALEKAKGEISKVTGVELDKLNNTIRTLEENLKKAQEQKIRAISRAQQTKSGHIYIVSNIGSFGENIYKFGMTRRLDPQDRIDELGNASVPFDFDVHGLIYTENAPELESKLHKHLDHKRINLIQLRREFFNVTMDEIEEVVKELKLDIQLTKLAEAKDYRMTLSMKEALEKQTSQKEEDKTISKELDKFPTILN